MPYSSSHDNNPLCDSKNNYKINNNLYGLYLLLGFILTQGLITLVLWIYSCMRSYNGTLWNILTNGRPQLSLINIFLPTFVRRSSTLCSSGSIPNIIFGGIGVALSFILLIWLLWKIYILVGQEQESNNLATFVWVERNKQNSRRVVELDSRSLGILFNLNILENPHWVNRPREDGSFSCTTAKFGNLFEHCDGRYLPGDTWGRRIRVFFIIISLWLQTIAALIAGSLSCSMDKKAVIFIPIIIALFLLLKLGLILIFKPFYNPVRHVLMVTKTVLEITAAGVALALLLSSDGGALAPTALFLELLRDVIALIIFFYVDMVFLFQKPKPLVKNEDSNTVLSNPENIIEICSFTPSDSTEAKDLESNNRKNRASTMELFFNGGIMRLFSASFSSSGLITVVKDVTANPSRSNSISDNSGTSTSGTNINKTRAESVLWMNIIWQKPASVGTEEQASFITNPLYQNPILGHRKGVSQKNINKTPEEREMEDVQKKILELEAHKKKLKKGIFKFLPKRKQAAGDAALEELRIVREKILGLRMAQSNVANFNVL